MTYVVSTVDTMNIQIHTDEIGRYDDKTAARQGASAPLPGDHLRT